MRTLLLNIVLLAITATSLLAQTPGPATRPVARIAIVPMASTDHAAALGGIVKSLGADLSRNGAFQTTIAAPANDSTAAIDSAKKMSARFLITVSVQSVDSQLRIVGQIADLESDKIVGGIKATGQLRDLFGLEDALSADAMNQLRSIPAVAQAPATQPITVVVNTIQPVQSQPGGTFEGSSLQDALNSRRRPSQDYERRFRPTSVYSDWDYGGYYGGYYYNPWINPIYTGFTLTPVKTQYYNGSGVTTVYHGNGGQQNRSDKHDKPRTESAGESSIQIETK